MKFLKFFYKNYWGGLWFTLIFATVIFNIVGLKEHHIKEALIAIGVIVAIDIIALIGFYISYKK